MLYMNSMIIMLSQGIIQEFDIYKALVVYLIFSYNGFCIIPKLINIHFTINHFIYQLNRIGLFRIILNKL